VAVPTFVAAGTYLTEASGASAAVAVPAGVQANDVILVIVYKENTAAVTPPSGFIEKSHQAATGSQDHDTYVFWKRATGADSGTYSFTWTGSVWRTGFAMAFRGCVTSGDPIDVFSGATSGGTSVTASPAVSVTTTGADRLLVWLAGTYDVTTWTTPSTFTASAPAGAPASRLVHAARKAQAVAGASGSVTTTTTQSFTKTAHLVALLPVPSGTTYSKAGGAARSSAGSGSKSVLPANFVDKAGGAVRTGAGSGAKAIGKTNPKTGGAARTSAGSGAKSVINVPPDQLPSDVLDLSYWHLTTPEDSGDGDAEQINQPALDSFESAGFFVDDDGFVNCVAPVDGFTTSGASGAVRMELRQHYKSGYANAAMDPNGSGRWQMTITTSADPTSITGGSNPRKELIISQIHGAGDSPIPLILSAEWTSGGSPVTPRVRIFKNGPGLANLITGITTSTRLTFRIRIEDDRLKVWGVAGEVSDLAPLASPQYDWPISDFTDQSGWYYKCGAYHKTTIASGSSGEGIAKISFLEVLEPADDDPSGTTHDKTGGAAARCAGSGAKTVTNPTTYSKTGGAVRVSAGSGAKTVSVPAVYARTGGAARTSAGSGAKAVTSATTYVRTGGAAARGASAGAKVRTPATIHAEFGGAAAGAAGSGAVELVSAARHEKTGGAARVTAGSGAQSVTSATVYVRTGGGAARSASSGLRQTGGGVEYSKGGGAVGVGAGVGARESQHPDVYPRTGGATTTTAGSGGYTIASAVVHTRVGGASASVAGSGTAEHVPAVRHDRTGGATVRGAGSGSVDLTPALVHAKTGGASTTGAGAGIQDRTSATVYVRTGGAAVLVAGIGLVEVIHPADHAKAGGGAVLGVGSGRGRRGGRMRSGVPVAIGQFSSGTPVRR